ncbi:hypothetical protein [Anaerovibrio sp. RM50]|uniref:hypothetical protein n=1 Tax=Anaerovibrio sp. RM50 TaxID=1200557 RepID=UPI000486B0B9|nr:hypothetical protein [Anaerovibrio sp. RM50]
MREYNDYVSLTKRYLKNYNQFKVSVENMKEDIRSLEESIEKSLNVSAPIAKYGDEPSGGTGELNSVERAADQLVQMKNRLCVIKTDMNELSKRILKIDRALSGLKKRDAEIINERYFYGCSWEQIGDKHCCTAKWARDCGGEAVKQIAFMMFGMKVKPYMANFVFAD